MFEHITSSEIAGYAVGAVLLSATVSAVKIDSFIASSQRSSLGMCRKCGDLKLIACSKCKGFGLLKGPLDFVPVIGEKIDRRAKIRAPAAGSCSNCGGKGHFPCPECSLLSGD